MCIDNSNNIHYSHAGIVDQNSVQWRGFDTCLLSGGSGDGLVVGMLSLVHTDGSHQQHCFSGPSKCCIGNRQTVKQTNQKKQTANATQSLFRCLGLEHNREERIGDETVLGDSCCAVCSIPSSLSLSLHHTPDTHRLRRYTPP